MESSNTQEIETFTIEEVANMLKVDTRTIYRRCDDSDIPHFRVGDKGAIRFLKSKFLAWLEEQHKN